MGLQDIFQRMNESGAFGDNTGGFDGGAITKLRNRQSAQDKPTVPHQTSFHGGKTEFSQPTYNSEFPTTWAKPGTDQEAPGGPGIDKAILEKAQQNFIHNDEAGDTRLGGKFTPAGLNKSAMDAQNNASDMVRARKMIYGLNGTMAPSFGVGNF